MLISPIFRAINAIYDPNQPHEIENFNPEKADPLGRITCLRDQYPFNLPILTGFNPNLVTVQ